MFFLKYLPTLQRFWDKSKFWKVVIFTLPAVVIIGVGFAVYYFALGNLIQDIKIAINNAPQNTAPILEKDTTPVSETPQTPPDKKPIKKPPKEDVKPPEAKPKSPEAPKEPEKPKKPEEPRVLALVFSSDTSGQTTYWKVDVTGDNLKEYSGALPSRGAGWPDIDPEVLKRTLSFSEDGESAFISFYNHDQGTYYKAYNLKDKSYSGLAKPDMGYDELCRNVFAWFKDRHEILALDAPPYPGDWTQVEHIREFCTYDDRTGKKIRSIFLPKTQYRKTNYPGSPCFSPSTGWVALSGYGEPFDEGRMMMLNLKDETERHISLPGYQMIEMEKELCDDLLKLNTVILVRYEEIPKYLGNRLIPEMKIYNFETDTFSNPIILKNDKNSYNPEFIDIAPDQKHFLFQADCWDVFNIDTQKQTTVFCSNQVGNVYWGIKFIGWLD